MKDHQEKKTYEKILITEAYLLLFERDTYLSTQNLTIIHGGSISIL